MPQEQQTNAMWSLLKCAPPNFRHHPCWWCLWWGASPNLGWQTPLRTSQGTSHTWHKWFLEARKSWPALGGFWRCWEVWTAKVLPWEWSPFQPKLSTMWCSCKPRDQLTQGLLSAILIVSLKQSYSKRWALFHPNSGDSKYLTSPCPSTTRCFSLIFLF